MRLPSPPLRKKANTCSMLNALEKSADCSVPTHTYVTKDTFAPGCGTDGTASEDSGTTLRTRP
jgi:hypothetical protein